MATDSSSVNGTDDSDDKSESESDMLDMVGGCLRWCVAAKEGGRACTAGSLLDATTSAAITRLARLGGSMTYQGIINVKLTPELSFHLSRPPFHTASHLIR